MRRPIACSIALIALLVTGPPTGPCRASDFVSPASGRLTVVAIDGEIATPHGGVPVQRMYGEDSDRVTLGARWSLGVALGVRSVDARTALVSFGGKPLVRLASTDGTAFAAQGGWRASRDHDGWRVQSPDELASVFDGSGREISRTDRNGNAIVFTYDAQGRLRQVGTSTALRLDLEYGQDGSLAAVRDRAGAVVEYRYDARGRLAEVIARDAGRTTYGYAADDRLEVIGEPSGATVRFRYDVDGRVVERTSTWTGRTVLTYGPWTRTARADGYWAEMQFDAHGRASAQRDSLGRREAWTWNEAGQLEAQTFADGSTATYAYDAAGRLVRQAGSRGEVLAIRYDGSASRPLEVDMNGAVTRFVYDAKGNLIEQRTPAGRSTRYGYDALGRRTVFIDGAGRTIRYEYDAAGRTTNQMNPDGGEWAWQYDAAGRLERERDPEGRLTRYGYTAQGWLASTMSPGGVPRTFEYDDAGRLVSDTTGTQVTGYRYDATGKSSAIEFPEGGRLQIVYDTTGRVARVTDAAGGLTASEYDGLGRPIKTVLPSGLEVARTFASSGALTSLRVGESRWRFDADPAAGVAEVVAPDGAKVGVRSDAFGQPTAIILPAGGEERRRYDPDGLLTSIVSALGEEWRVTYGPAGDPMSLHLPDGTEQRFAYDAAGRLAAVTYPAGNGVTYRYDRASRITARSTAAGSEVTYEYDAGGRMTAKRGPQYAWSYRYDAQGRMTEAAGNDYMVRFEYDSAGRVTSVDYPRWGKHVAYAYDAAGRLASRTDPDGVPVRYGYDALDRLTSIEAQGERFGFEYDAHDRLTRSSASNGTSVRYDYDAAGRVTQVNHLDANGKPIVARRYRYDAAGNRIETLDERDRKSLYRFDRADQLIGEDTPVGVIEYRLGRAGQRLSVVSAGGSIGYRYDPSARLVQVGEVAFEYDAQGNVASRRTPSGTTRYSYDAEGRLVRVALPEGKSVSYGYGPFGERLWREEGGRRTYYLYDGEDLLAELSSRFEPQRSFVYRGLDRPLLARSASGGRTFYHADELGTVLALTDGSGRVSARYDYDAFGNVVREEGSAAAQPLRFTGRPLDSATRLYDLRARFYDAQIGRFLSPDPTPGDTDDPMSLLPYVYARNNPVTYVDPFGGQYQPGPVEMAVWWGLRYAKPGVDVRWPWLQGELAGYALRNNLRYPPPPGAVKPNSPFWEPARSAPRLPPPSAQAANLGVTGGIIRRGDTVVIRVPQPSLAARAATAMREGASRASAALAAAGPGAIEVSRAAGLANAAMGLGDMVGEVSSAAIQGDNATAALGDAARQLGVTTLGGAAVGYAGAYAAPLLPAAAGATLAIGGAAVGGVAVVVGSGSRVVALAQELGQERVDAPQRERALRAQQEQQRTLVAEQDAILDGLRGRLAEARTLAAAASAIVEEVRDRKFEVANVRNRIQAFAAQAAAAKERAEKAAESNATLAGSVQRYAIAESAAGGTLTDAENAANDACVAVQIASPTADQASAALAAARRAAQLATQANTTLPVPLDFEAALLLAQDAQSPAAEYEALRARAAAEVASLDGLLAAVQGGAATYDQNAQKAAGLRDDVRARAQRLMVFDEIKDKAAAIVAEAQALAVPSGEGQALAAEALGLAGEARGTYNALRPLPAAAAQAGQDLDAMRGRFAALRQRADAVSSRAADCAQRVAAAAAGSGTTTAAANACAGDIDCPVGFVCGPQKTCVAQATTGTPQTIAAGGAPECRTHAECPADSACVNGKCVKAPSPTDVVAGFDRGAGGGQRAQPLPPIFGPRPGRFDSDTLQQDLRERSAAAAAGRDREYQREGGPGPDVRGGAAGVGTPGPATPGAGGTGGVTTPGAGASGGTTGGAGSTGGARSGQGLAATANWPPITEAPLPAGGTRGKYEPYRVERIEQLADREANRRCTSTYHAWNLLRAEELASYRQREVAEAHNVYRTKFATRIEVHRIVVNLYYWPEGPSTGGRLPQDTHACF